MILVIVSSRSLCRMTPISDIKASPRETCKHTRGLFHDKTYASQPPEGHSSPQSFPFRDRSGLHSESSGSQESPQIHRLSANGKRVSIRYRPNRLRRNTYLLQQSQYLPQMLVIRNNGHQSRGCGAERRFWIQAHHVGVLRAERSTCLDQR